MVGNSQRQGAVRKRGKGTGQGNTAGSGGRRRRGLEGKGPTPKAEDRPYHKAYKAKSDSSRGERDGRPRSGPRSRHGGPDWVAGRNPVVEAINAAIPATAIYVATGTERDERLRHIFASAANVGIPLLEVTRPELDRLTEGAVHQGVAMKLPEYQYQHPDDLIASSLTHDQPLLVAIDSITDPRNLGAIIRSAAAFGAQGVIIPERRNAQMTAAAWKSSAGAAAKIPVSRATNLNRTLTAAKKAGFMVVGLAGDDGTDIDQLVALDQPVLLVVGSEDQGLARLTRENCEQLAAIPMSDQVESLNASVAAGIALFAINQSRRSTT